MGNTKKFRGGLRIGANYLCSTNFSWPLAMLFVSDSELVLSSFRFKYSFRKSSIKSIVNYKGYFSRGIKIEHNGIDIDEFIVFWTFRQNLVIDCLKDSGWAVEPYSVKASSGGNETNCRHFSRIFTLLIYFTPVLLAAILLMEQKYLLAKGLADSALNAFGMTGILALSIFVYKRLANR